MPKPTPPPIPENGYNTHQYGYQHTNYQQENQPRIDTAQNAIHIPEKSSFEYRDKKEITHYIKDSGVRFETSIVFYHDGTAQNLEKGWFRYADENNKALKIAYSISKTKPYLVTIPIMLMIILFGLSSIEFINLESEFFILLLILSVVILCIGVMLDALLINAIVSILRKNYNKRHPNQYYSASPI